MGNETLVEIASSLDELVILGAITLGVLVGAIICRAFRLL